MSLQTLTKNYGGRRRIVPACPRAPLGAALLTSLAAWLSLAAAAGPGAPPAGPPPAPGAPAQEWGAAARAAAPAPPVSSPPASFLKEAAPAELTQFYNEFNRHGWQGAVIASLPREYVMRDGVVYDVGGQFATLYGDVDGDRKPEWVVGCYLPIRAEDPPGSMSALAVNDGRARLAVFKRDASGRWRLHWRSPGLGYEFSRPEFNIREVESGLDSLENIRLPIALVNVNGDQSLEIAYYCRSSARMIGALPGVYRHNAGRWVSVAPQADRFSLQNVDGKGQLELVTGSQFIGYGNGDDDVPRVWRWNGQREQFQEASAEFPEFYARLAARYEAYVRRLEAAGRDYDRAAWARAIQKATSLAG
jgi:hypothetical protein